MPFLRDGAAVFASHPARAAPAARVTHQRALGLAYAPHPDGPWTVLDEPVLPQEHQVENSSLDYDRTSVGGSGSPTMWAWPHRAWTDTIGVYWSKDPTQWDPACKAVAFDGHDCTWSRRRVGMLSVVSIGDRLAMFCDAPGGDGISHMRRDIGLAWFGLPLTPPGQAD